MNQTLKAALGYLAQGLCVIPIRPRAKQPLVQWQEFQHRLPTEEELYHWFDAHPDRNLAIVCGAISNDLVVVDIDGPEGLEWARVNFPMTTVYTKTPKADATWHLYFRGRGIRNSKPHPQVDIRGDGGYVVAPPSIHPNGGAYQLQILEGSDGWDGLATLTTTAVGLDLSTVRTSPVTEAKAEGSRNQTLAQLVGKWCARGNDLEDIMILAEGWNARNTPPLPAPELFRTVQSIVTTHNRNHPGAMVTEAGQDELPEVDLGNPQDAEFPAELLNPGGILQRIMDYTDRSNAASVPVFALAGAISLLGTICGYRIQGSTQLKTNTYIISLGSSGTGKNAVCSTIPTLLAACARPAHGPTDLASAAAILRHLHPPEQRVTLICADEIGMLLKGLRYPESPKAEIPSLLTKLFSATNRPSIKSFADAKLNLTVPYHCLSVYGASTHVEFWKGIHFDDSANGFLARILLFDFKGRAPRPKDSVDTTLPPDLVRDLSAIWGITPPIAPGSGNVDKIPAPFAIPFSPEAQWLWEPWSKRFFDIREAHANEPAKASIYNRAVEHAWKLALIHAVSTQGAAIINGGTISHESTVWATKLSERLVADMIKNIGECVSDNEWHADQKKVVAIIRKVATTERPGAGLPDIKRRLPMDPRRFDAIILTLEQAGKIHRRMFKGNRGPETTIFCVSKEGAQR